MSVASAKSYYLRLATDADFLQQVNAAESVEGRLRLAQQAGFDFTLDEVNEALVTLMASGSLTEFLGESNAEVLAYTALSFLELQRRAVPPYGPPTVWLQPFQALPPTTFRPS